MENYISKIICGDCLEVMPSIPGKSIDMILCDLPYGTTACKWDTAIPFEPLWEQYKRIIKDNGAIVLTASQPFTSALVMSNLKMFKYELIWDKLQGKQPMLAHKRIMKSFENILVFYKSQPIFNPQMREGNKYKDKRLGSNYSIHRGRTKPREMDYSGRFPLGVLAFPFTNTPNQHPTQKPVALFEYLIKTYTNENDLVLDNCAGSGTTGVACKNLNRRFILIEKEEKYCNDSRDRIDNTEEPLF